MLSLVSFVVSDEAFDICIHYSHYLMIGHIYRWQYFFRQIGQNNKQNVSSLHDNDYFNIIYRLLFISSRMWAIALTILFSTMLSLDNCLLRESATLITFKKHGSS